MHNSPRKLQWLTSIGFDIVNKKHNIRLWHKIHITKLLCCNIVKTNEVEVIEKTSSKIEIKELNSKKHFITKVSPLSDPGIFLNNSCKKHAMVYIKKTITGSNTSFVNVIIKNIFSNLYKGDYILQNYNLVGSNHPESPLCGINLLNFLNKPLQINQLKF